MTDNPLYAELLKKNRDLMIATPDEAIINVNGDLTIGAISQFCWLAAQYGRAALVNVWPNRSWHEIELSILAEHEARIRRRLGSM